MMVESSGVAAQGVSDIQDPSLTDPGNYHSAGGGSKPTVYSFPMVRESDMGAEMQQEVVELCGIACERHASNNENAAKAIKEEMDRKYGNSWHVVVGEGFGFEVSYEVSTLLYMFFAGNLAVCVWKCS